MVYVKYSTSDPTSKIARGRKSKSVIFALFDGGIPLVLQGGGYTIKMSKSRKIAFFYISDLGRPRRMDQRSLQKEVVEQVLICCVLILEKCFLLWFFRNSQNKLTASEAAEAGLDRPKTSALMSKGCMQSFEVLALKLRPWWGHRATYRDNFWVFLYIVRC